MGSTSNRFYTWSSVGARGSTSLEPVEHAMLVQLYMSAWQQAGHWCWPTPHVAGVAGLLWMYFPQCKNYQMRNAILATAEDLRTDGCDIETGFGVVRAKSAYELLAKGNCGGNLGVTDGTVGGGDQLTPAAPSSAAPSSAPNPAPSTPSSPYPTHTAPTMYPTHTAPTPYPTEVPPTPYPSGKTCAVKSEPCKNHKDCCKKKCNRKKGFCRK